MLFGFSILLEAEQEQVNKINLFMSTQEEIKPFCPNFCH